MKHSRLTNPLKLGGVFRAAALAAVLLGAGAAQADTRPVERYDVRNAGMSAGAARTVVRARDGVVRSVVTDFGRYPDFISRFKTAKVIGKSGDKTDVYLQVPILNGAVKIWAVVRFDPPKEVNGGQVVMGKMIKGNVKRLDATWRIQPLDDQSTELKLELLIVPDLPVPEAVVLPEVRYAAAKAVSGTRDEAERRASH